MEPFGFFSVEALRAGWYLIWRQFVRVLPVGAGSVLVGIFLMSHGLRPLGGFLIGIGLIVAAVWAAVLIPRLTSQWSQSYYGFPLTGGSSLWWNVSWRTWVASFVAAIVLTPPQMVAASLEGRVPRLGAGRPRLASLSASWVSRMSPWPCSRPAGRCRESALELRAATLLRYGAGVDEGIRSVRRSRAHAGAARHHAGRRPVRWRWPRRLPQPHTRGGRAPRGRRTGGRAVAAGPPAPTVARRQPPRASGSAEVQLYETELGKVIGWYCRVCGWRESRR